VRAIIFCPDCEKPHNCDVLYHCECGYSSKAAEEDAREAALDDKVDQRKDDRL